MKEADKPNYYGILPAEVRYSKISPSAKVLYSELTALTSKSGICTASNRYFAELYDVRPETVSAWFSELSKAGFIEIIYEKQKNNTIFRKIAIPLAKIPIPPCEKPQSPPCEKPKGNNTSLFNNTSKKNKASNEAEIPFAEIIEYLNLKAGKRYPVDGKQSKSFIKSRWKDGYRLDDFKKVVDNMVFAWKDKKGSNGFDGNTVLRPKTLFGTSMEDYLQQIPPPDKKTKMTPEEEAEQLRRFGIKTVKMEDKNEVLDA